MEKSNIEKKYGKLKELLAEHESLAVCFSGGVDSVFLLYAAHEVLGDKVTAITAAALPFPERELDEAKTFCQSLGVKHEVFDFDVLSIKKFRENPKDRCYFCKKELMRNIKKIAAENNIELVAEGSNLDDMGDYRPGIRAVSEEGIISPLREVGLTKNEIRSFSKKFGLASWDKPSFACLASRFVYGETITAEKLIMTGKAESYLLKKGFTQVRVRVHGDMARLEVLPEEMGLLFEGALREDIAGYMSSLGFTYTSVDLRGYRTGSMNETI